MKSGYVRAVVHVQVVAYLRLHYMIDTRDTPVELIVQVTAPKA